MSAVPVSLSPAIDLRAGKITVRYFDGVLWFGCYADGKKSRLGDPLVAGTAALLGCCFIGGKFKIGSTFLYLDAPEHEALRSWLDKIGIECLEHYMRFKGTT